MYLQLSFTSIYPGVLRRINNLTLYEDNPLELKDIYDREELNTRLKGNG